MASKPGGYSGGSRGPMGSHTGPGSAGGTGFDRPDKGFSGGMQGATARRTAVQSPGYDASMGNLMGLGKSVAGFLGGPVGSAASMIGGYGPSYSGYTGHVNTPGSYDPKGGPQMQGGGAGGSLGLERYLLTGGYGGANRALYTPGMGGAPQMFMPKPAAQVNPAAAPGAALPQQSFAPGMFMNTGGKYGSSAYRPGYSFFGPGGV
jgi:hypothetical protein